MFTSVCICGVLVRNPLSVLSKVEQLAGAAARTSGDIRDAASRIGGVADQLRAGFEREADGAVGSAEKAAKQEMGAAEKVPPPFTETCRRGRLSCLFTVHAIEKMLRVF